MKKVITFLVAVMMTAALFADGHAVKKQAGSKEFRPAAAEEKDHVCYKSIAMQVGHLAKTEKYDKAMDLLQKAKENPNYGHHMEHIYNTMAEINSEKGDYRKNIDVWKEGHEKGVVFNIDPTDEKYKPYAKIKGFKDAYMKDKMVYKSKNKVMNKKKHGDDCDDEKVKEKSSGIKNTSVKKLLR